MKRSKRFAACAAVLSLVMLSSAPAFANQQVIEGLKIAKLRSVGNYEGDVYDNTIELWFTVPLTFAGNITCTNTARVFVDAKYKQLVAAAHAALASGKTVTINVDDALPQRAGTCEISYLDIF